MKKIFAIIVLVCLGACTTTQDNKPLTPSQVLSQACPSIQGVFTVLTTPGVVSVETELKLVPISKSINTVCAMGNLATIPDVKTLTVELLPQVIEVVNASNLSDEDKHNAIIGLAIAKAFLAPLIVQ